MDLRSELLHKRSAAMGRLMEKRDYDEAARKFIEEHVICRLRALNDSYPNLSYYSITYYVVEHGDGYYVAYNLNTRVGCDMSNPIASDASREILDVASVIARHSYNLNTTIFYEEGMTAYRFAISFK